MPEIPHHGKPSGPLSDFTDQLRGLHAQWGSLKCGCHPNCGIGTLLLVNTKTHQAVPVAELLNTDRLLEDLKVINDRHRSRPVMITQALDAVSFQPVSFTGRDEELPPEKRARWRYTLSYLARDVQQQTGMTEPLRDWYPLSDEDDEDLRWAHGAQPRCH